MDGQRLFAYIASHGPALCSTVMPFLLLKIVNNRRSKVRPLREITSPVRPVFGTRLDGYGGEESGFILITCPRI
ncbi:hypothetical protein AAFF_G00339220 [Aldrovandia affinis]|uniref:Uncharacterized protein n=1 Tax=Aldrovandia affinis TaxID=143900 RepID=A0AAD7SK73_9TELE|nr:hypothetical protein AAFF_G00339220 [Aldrovandia affinis]